MIITTHIHKETNGDWLWYVIANFRMSSSGREATRIDAQECCETFVNQKLLFV
jgi:hypothetical protein